MDTIGFYDWAGSEDPFSGWNYYSVAYATSGAPAVPYGAYCPGSALISTDIGYYAPPFLRACVNGYYCPIPSLQLACQDLVLTPKAGGATDGAGTYALDARTLNGFPIYVNSAKGRFLGYHPSGYWVLADAASLTKVLASQGAFAGLGTSNGSDPKVGWGGYTATNAVVFSGGLQCPLGTLTPKACSAGSYCPSVSAPAALPCQDLIFTAIPSGGVTYADGAGTYKLDVRVLNGFPVYVNTARGRFVGYHPSGFWVMGASAGLSAIVASQGAFAYAAGSQVPRHCLPQLRVPCRVRP